MKLYFMFLLAIVNFSAIYIINGRDAQPVLGTLSFNLSDFKTKKVIILCPQ
jgi:hypothetical protein